MKETVFSAHCSWWVGGGLHLKKTKHYSNSDFQSILKNNRIETRLLFCSNIVLSRAGLFQSQALLGTLIATDWSRNKS